MTCGQNNTKSESKTWYSWRSAVAILALCVGGRAAIAADSPEKRVKIDIPPQPLSEALLQFGHQTGMQIMFASDVAGTQTTRGLKGTYPASVALNQLLNGSGLTYQSHNNTVTVIPVRLASVASTDLPQGSTDASVAKKNDEAATEGTAQKTNLEQVTVTAQKREERLQDVPMSLTALSGDELTRTQAFRFEDYVGSVPGLSLINYGALGSQLVIRGVTSGETAVNSSVATYIDETPYTAEGPFAGSYFIAPNLDTFDMQRIEVLRGPQGTLYGANALGGLLKYVTNAPDPSHFAAQVEAGTSFVDSGGTGFETHGMVNLPIASSAAVRLVGYDNYYPGFIDDPSRGLTDINGSRFTGGRGSFLLNPVDNVSIRLNAFYQDRSWSDRSAEDVNPGTLTPIYGKLTQETLVGQPGDSITRLYNITASWDASFAKLLSTTSYLNNQTGDRFDDSTVFGPLFSYFVGSPVGVAYPYKFQMKAVTEEVRLSSANDEVLQWQVGVFYTNQNASEAISLDPIDPATRTILGNSPYVTGQAVTPHYRESAGFASVDYHVTSAFDISLGGRYSGNDQRLRQVGSGFLFKTLNIDNTSSEDVFTYSGDLRWHVTAEDMLYARVAEGYSPGGPANVVPEAPVPKFYESSTTVNYELGIKSEFLDNRLTADLSAFLINWHKIQLQAIVGNFSTFTNGGTATSRGFEWSLNYAPVGGLRLGLNGSYTNAHLTQATPASVGGQIGDRLPSVPLLQTSLSAEYEHTLFGQFSGFAGANYRFTGSRYAEFEPAGAGQRQEMPSFGIVDLRAGVETSTLSIALFIKNVANKLAINYLSDETVAGAAGPQSAVMYQPRTIGITASMRF